MNHLLETFAILGAVDGVRRGTNNRHALGFQGSRQFQGCLTTKLHDHALGLLQIDNLQHILQRHRLEIQAIRGIVISGDGLRITVDHDGFIAIFTHGQRRVHAAVIEFNTLADAIGATAQHQDLVPIGGGRLALLLVGGIHIGGGGGEFGRAGVHSLVDRADTQTLAMLPNLCLGGIQQHGQALVRKTLALQAKHLAMIHFAEIDFFKAVFSVYNVLDLHQEPGIHTGVLVDLIDSHSCAKGIGQVPDAIGSGIGQLRHQVVTFVGIIDIDHVFKTGGIHFQSTQRFLQ